MSDIWIYWNTGFENSPQVVQDCVESWKYHNPSHDIHLLTDENLTEYIPQLKRPKSIPAWSDIVRINILKRHGGLWVDSTVLCNKSLDCWLPHYSKNGFFAFSEPTPNIKICSWFLYTKKGNLIVEKWQEEVEKYWFKREKSHDYFWFHLIFNQLYEQNSQVKNIWDRTPKYKANWNPVSENGANPHYFAPYAPSRINNLSFQSMTAPVYKLRHGSSELITNSELYKKLIGKMK